MTIHTPLKRPFSLLLTLIVLLTRCATIPPSEAESRPPNTPAPATATRALSPTEAAPVSAPTRPVADAPSPTPTLPPTPTLAPEAWMEMPAIPSDLSPRVREIYAHGQELGRDPQRFSKAGDCESTTGWYLAEFDQKPVSYRLGEKYAYLQDTIDYYADSFKRESVAVRRGANTSALLTTLWADPAQCEPGETMLACEYRLHNPALALIAVGSNDLYKVDDFEGQMRQIIEFTIAEGIVPILSTKADNLEGNHSINAILGRLAYEYDIPLWNFWRVVQPLPDHGLQEDGAHLTFGGNIFDDPFRMTKAWPWRNLTALQTLDALRIGLQTPAP